MKYSSSLLKKFISVNDTPENIAKNLILKTCEIEEIHHRNIAKSIVIWYVKTCEKHPDADKLSVCQVNCGTEWEYQIICGGSNVAAWLYVPVALPGTHFPKIGITIEPRKMRGLESNGMICSKEEIGILEDMEKHSIWSLTEDLEDISDADLGTSLSDKFPRLEGRIMEVDNKSLTNRPDLTGHFGAATELNAIYSLENNQISFNKVKDYHEQCTSEHSMQILENSTKPERKVIGESEGLNTYTLLHIKNINIQQTSFFTRLQLLDLWSNPINNRVDFSNLFMNITGQPIHFFDAEKVDGDIIVRNAKDGEKFIDLFESEHTLKVTDVVIADKKKILALAGVVGGLESWITDNTKNILVEIANFDPVAVRKTGTRLGLRTDAELRYEKNINPRYTLFCLTFFLDELNYYKKDLGDFEIGGLSYYINEKINKESKKTITIDSNVLEKFIFGKKIKGLDKKVEEILSGLWFIDQGKGTLLCPLRRWPDDLNIPEDIYEEVARIYGYDQIENIPLLSDTVHVPYSPYVAIQRKLEDILVRNIGCNQIETYPRVSEKLIQKDWTGDISYKLQNPTNPDMPYLRGNMNYWLLEQVAKNSKFFDEFKIFDIGKVWNKRETKEQRDKDIKYDVPTAAKEWNFASNFVVEKTALGIMLYTKNITTWDQDPLLIGKNIIKLLLKNLWIMSDISRNKTDSASYHPNKQANIELNMSDWLYRIWFIWNQHPLTLSERKISENAWVTYIALDIDRLLCALKSQGEKTYTYETLQDQIIWRDLCFVIDTNKSFDTVITAVKKVPEVKDVEVFDVYTGKNLGEDKKSVSIKIKLIGDGTMTTEQINEVMNKAIAAAESVGWTLRA